MMMKKYSIKRLPLTAKLIGLHIVAVILLGIGIILFVKGFLANKLTTELQNWGMSITRNLSANSVEYILTNDLVSCQRLINRVKELEKDIVYVFILDDRGNPLVHTFEEGVPQSLIEIDTKSLETAYKIRLLDTEYGLIRDICMPILESSSLGNVHVGASEARITNTVTLIVNRMILTILLILIIGAGMIYWLSRIMLSPLIEISKTIKEIGSGDFQPEIKVKTNDAVGFLANTFNEMAKELQKANLELENTQSQLIQTAKMASVGQFSAGIAHEVNNPLAGILNCIRSLLGDPAIKGQRRGYLELALKGLLRIENTISRILSFSGRQELKPQLSHIKQLIVESLTFFQHRLEEQEIILEQNLTNSLPPILIDPHQMQQVFMNVTSNALDALSPGEVLSIATALKGNTIEIIFKDKGKGIKPEDLDNIFDPFFTTKEVGKGVGLGLSISYAIVQRHDGTIDIRSKENEGTTVTIILPLKE